MRALRPVARALRDDFWTAGADRRPRERRRPWPPFLEIPPLLLFGAFLVSFNWERYSTGYQLGFFGALLAGAQTVVPLLAPHRPIPAWWTSTLTQVALVAVWFTPDGVALGSRPDWSGLELALQTWVLFLVALRTRLRVAVEALVISVATSLVFILVWGYGGYIPLTVAVLVIAMVVGASLRARDVARTQLVVQEELTTEERARRTLLEERTRIARELHDVVAHHMSVISIQAQAAPHLVENPTAELKENLESIRENAKEALTELRQVLGVLRSEHTPPEDERHTPQPSLDRLDDLVSNVLNAGLTVTTRITGERVQLTPGIELSAFRIIQEALSNAIRHAPGAEARVEIAYAPSGVTIRIGNTAPPRPAPPSPGAGHGLLGMRERAAMLGGTLTCGSTTDGGYEVTATLPIKAVATE